MVTLEKLQARQYVHRGDRFQSVFNIRFKKPKKKNAFSGSCDVESREDNKLKSNVEGLTDDGIR